MKICLRSLGKDLQPSLKGPIIIQNYEEVGILCALKPTIKMQKLN